MIFLPNREIFASPIFKRKRMFENVLVSVRGRRSELRSLKTLLVVFRQLRHRMLITIGSHASVTVLILVREDGVTNKETNMVSPSPVDSFFATFTGLKKVFYRNVSLLAIILFPLTYQMIIVEFLIEEHTSGACNNTGKFGPKLRSRSLF